MIVICIKSSISNHRLWASFLKNKKREVISYFICVSREKQLIIGIITEIAACHASPGEYYWSHVRAGVWTPRVKQFVVAFTCLFPLTLRECQNNVLVPDDDVTMIDVQ